MTATPDSLGYRLRKTAQRHPVWVSALAAAAVFAVSGVIFLGYHADRLNRERTRAVEAEHLARQEADAASSISSFLEGLLTDIDPEQGRGGEVTAAQLLDDGARRLQTELRDQPLVRGRLLRIMAQSRHSMAQHEEALALLDSSLAAFAGGAGHRCPPWPNGPQVHSLIGTTNYDLGNYAEAEAHDRRALALTPGSDAGPVPPSLRTSWPTSAPACRPRPGWTRPPTCSAGPSPRPIPWARTASPRPPGPAATWATCCTSRGTTGSAARNWSRLWPSSASCSRATASSWAIP